MRSSLEVAGGIGTLMTRILEWSSGKVGRVCLKRTSRIEQAGGDCFVSGARGTGTGGVREGRGGGMTAVLGIQLVNRSRSFKMAVSYL
jgi:hypothetical protein